MPFEDLRKPGKSRGCVICGEKVEGYATVAIRGASSKDKGSTVVSRSRSMCEQHAREWWDRALATFDAP